MFNTKPRRQKNSRKNYVTLAVLKRKSWEFPKQRLGKFRIFPQGHGKMQNTNRQNTL